MASLYRDTVLLVAETPSLKARKPAFLKWPSLRPGIAVTWHTYTGIPPERQAQIGDYTSIRPDSEKVTLLILSGFFVDRAVRLLFCLSAFGRLGQPCQADKDDNGDER